MTDINVQRAINDYRDDERRKTRSWWRRLLRLLLGRGNRDDP